jgi:hypothetical protein
MNCVETSNRHQERTASPALADNSLAKPSGESILNHEQQRLQNASRLAFSANGQGCVHR